MRRYAPFLLALAALALPASASASPTLSIAKVKAEAAEIGRDLESHRSTGVSGYYVTSCKRRSARRVICRLVLLSETEGGPPAMCDIPVMGILKRGKLRILLAPGDCMG